MKKLLRPSGSNLVLLDEKGNPQMYLQGGELIISRKETEELINLSKKVKSDDDYIQLGKMIHKIREKQKRNKDQYTKQ
jgi:hypothetical protein